MEPKPVFHAPDFRAIADYPVQCKNRFLEACAQRAAAPFHVDKRRYANKAWAAVDDYLTWLAVYGDE